ncbi:MAG: recombinase family protein [Lachnospiraceae bacterium]|nr:recombinase family protein [Lachnospiraceae bacterium]MDD3616605.1 recombinase family protein [Lachnospiraceae bacterium]
MRKIAIYCRQSIDKKDSLSIETQEEFCRNFINTKPNKSPVEVYFDKGYSGKNTLRPDFQRMHEDVCNNKIEKIVVYKLDRISRNLNDFCNMYEEFKQYKVEFCSVNESFDTTTAMGRGMLKIAMVFAEMERENIQLRVRDNYYQRIKTDGRWAGGPAPYGFENGRTKDKKPTLHTYEAEMEIVRFCFQQYAYAPNTSLRQLANQLIDKGYRSRRKNGGWDNVTLARMLQNPVYAVADERLQKFYEIRKVKFLNDTKWDGTTSCHIVGKKVGNVNIRKYTDLSEQSVYLTNFEGMIDSKTFIMVQERLAQNEQIKRSNAPSALQELAGLIKCKSCGYAVKSYSKSTNGRPYLSCYGRL